jgi:hypothetical protein
MRPAKEPLTCFLSVSVDLEGLGLESLQSPSFWALPFLTLNGRFRFCFGSLTLSHSINEVLVFSILKHHDSLC